MEAIKQTRIKRTGKELILVLPDNFTADEVDILIWPSNEGIEICEKKISDDLLQWPEMSDEELATITEKRKHLNAWK